MDNLYFPREKCRIQGAPGIGKICIFHFRNVEFRELLEKEICILRCWYKKEILIM